MQAAGPVFSMLDCMDWVLSIIRDNHIFATLLADIHIFISLFNIARKVERKVHCGDANGHSNANGFDTGFYNFLLQPVPQFIQSCVGGTDGGVFKDH